MNLRTDGKTRLVLIIGSYAFKFARGRDGCLCNLYEAKVWNEATASRREMLCPVLACAPAGVLLLMPAARPLTPAEYEQRVATDNFPDWDYWPGDPEDPVEDTKAEDWGIFEGRLVALDYGGNALLNRPEER